MAAQGPEIIFRGEDTGVGLTPSQAARVWDRFYQAESSSTRRFGGAGLGLAITRHFCQAMGGDIGVESLPGVGSTFTIRLPAVVGAAIAAVGRAG